MIDEATKKNITALVRKLFECYTLKEGEWYDVHFTCMKDKKIVDFCALMIDGTVERKIIKGVHKHKMGRIICETN